MVIVRATLTLISALLVAPPLAAAAQLEIFVTGVRSDRGVIRVAVYDDPNGFPKAGRQLVDRALTPLDGTARIVIGDLPEGRYAIAAFHDENNNSAFDRRFGILPKEGYGFSNDAKPVFRAPRFEQAAFDLPVTGITVSFAMIY